ncbi:hypothetical protein [Kyrpidia sp.]|uniref:hypothetical protein n=1 Tax=Kyrpidia sp. TaxID=2073077 RepID=UPI00258ACF99|nr:hypothetical protein [Kyrpidia sp.]MCL6577541.1 hypothetical protein [Kyrpidia sp.]
MRASPLSTILENLQQAYHLVDDTLHIIEDSGSFAVLAPEVAAVRDKLNALAEIAAALLDVQREGKPP